MDITNAEMIAGAASIGMVVWGAFGWFMRTLSAKVDGLMGRTKALETHMEHYPDTDKVREILDTTLTRVMAPLDRKLEHVESTMNKLQLTVATAMGRRRRDDVPDGD